MDMTAITHASGAERMPEWDIEHSILNADEDTLRDVDILQLMLKRGGAGEYSEGLASYLIKKFHSLSGIVNTPRAQLVQYFGGESKIIDEIQLFRRAMQCTLRAELIGTPVTYCLDSLNNYCRNIMTSSMTDQIRIFYLDKHTRILRDAVHQLGTIDYTALYPREIVSNALLSGAAKIMIANIRPFGTPDISERDVEMVWAISRAVSAVGIDVFDFIVTSPGGDSSFKRDSIQYSKQNGSQSRKCDAGTSS
jgi:DNA repair protein RadC